MLNGKERKKKKGQRKNEKTFNTLIALSVALFTGLIASFRHFMRGIQGAFVESGSTCVVHPPKFVPATSTFAIHPSLSEVKVPKEEVLTSRRTRVNLSKSKPKNLN